MKRLAAVLALLFLAVSAQAGKFDAEEPRELIAGVKLSGLLDLRGYHADKNDSWLRGGTSPFRFGGRDINSDGIGDRRVTGASIPQASLVVDAEVHPRARVHLHGNFTTDAASGSAKVGLIEAYAETDAEWRANAFRLRAGGLIPPLSWEHPNVAWSTQWTLTPSAIGSWVGEEIRGYGVEGSWEFPLWERGGAFLGPVKGRLTGAGFSGGDQIGRLLWFRGWGLHDLQGDLTPEYTIFGRTVRPMDELDGRLGYYYRGDLTFMDRALQVGGGTWTNNGNDGLGNAGDANLHTQAFRTKAQHYGGKFEWKRLTLAGQHMKATISAVDKGRKDWSAAYGLASLALGRARLSGRYERTWTRNWDNTFTYTGYAGWSFGPQQEVSAEYIYTSAWPLQAIRPRSQIDRLFQLGYRLRF